MGGQIVDDPTECEGKPDAADTCEQEDVIGSVDLSVGIRQETLTTNDDDDETEEAEELELERVRRPEVRAEFPQSLKEDGPRRNLVLVFVFVVLLRLGSDRDDGDGRRATGDYVRESECEGEGQ